MGFAVGLPGVAAAAFFRVVAAAEMGDRLNQRSRILIEVVLSLFADGVDIFGVAFSGRTKPSVSGDEDASIPLWTSREYPMLTHRR